MAQSESSNSEKSSSRRGWRSWFVVVGLGLALGAGLAALRLPKLEEEKAVADAFPTAPPVVIPVEELFPFAIKSGETLSTILGAQGVDSKTIHDLVLAAKPTMDLGRLRTGTRFQILKSNEETPRLVGLNFRFSPVERLEIREFHGQWQVQKIQEAVETRVITFTGVVTSSLWESAESASMDPSLISDLAEIFAWQVDFAREVRVNDRWRLSVEQKLVKGQPVGWGSILAAEYENAGQIHTAILFRGTGETGYYGPDGSSLRRMFLKSPIQYGRISSRFARSRFHPILKFARPHLGVDYAAAPGTPVRAVGGGVVTQAGWNGAAGNTLRIRHNSIYETAYKHLKGFAKGVRVGAKVQQGQTVAYVGTTGLSTGPHLHFEFYKSGQFVDPLGQKFPTADPVPHDLMAQFQAESRTRVSTLPGWVGNREASSTTGP